MSIATRLRTLFPSSSRNGNRPPLLEGAQPLVGHILPFQKDPVQLMFDGKRRYGNVFSIHLVGTTAAVLLGAEGNEAVFRAPDDQLNPKEAYKLMTPIFGKGIAYDATDDTMR